MSSYFLIFLLATSAFLTIVEAEHSVSSVSDSSSDAALNQEKIKEAKEQMYQEFLKKVMEQADKEGEARRKLYEKVIPQ